jgi:uncharacterized membrane protein
MERLTTWLGGVALSCLLSAIYIANVLPNYRQLVLWVAGVGMLVLLVAVVLCIIALIQDNKEWKKFHLSIQNEKFMGHTRK